MATTERCATLGGTTYAVTVPDDPDGVDLHDLARAECAIALAALASGDASPETLRYARRALGHTIGTMASDCACDPSDVRAWEAGTRPIPPRYVEDARDLLTMSDRGGFVARRVA